MYKSAQICVIIGILSYFLPASLFAESVILLQIEKNHSSFYREGFGPIDLSNENVAEQYRISGTFEVTFDTFSSVIKRIRFINPDIKTTLLPESEEFEFPQYPVVFENNSFSGNGNPCNFWDQGGTCYSMGNFGFFSGTFDGKKLTMTGADPINFSESYNFTISATVPSTLNYSSVLGPVLHLLLLQN